MTMPAACRPALLGTAFALLAACATVAGSGRMVDDGQGFTMRTGEQVTLPDHSTLRYVRIVNDSRCPPDVQCVWAGDAEIAFEWRASAAGVHAFSLHTTVGDKSATLGEWRLTLLSLARGDMPEAQLRIERSP